MDRSDHLAGPQRVHGLGPETASHGFPALPRLSRLLGLPRLHYLWWWETTLILRVDSKGCGAGSRMQILPSPLPGYGGRQTLQFLLQDEDVAPQKGNSSGRLSQIPTLCVSLPASR